MQSHDDIAIKVSNLSKCYQIYDKPHDRLKQSIYPRLQRLVGKPAKQYHREFWALKDVSFEIKKGETVGIIGRNGSGKSTLLQMICGTLNPTSGSVQTRGRIAALLELGSGFNPEFTGRENVYMNASILGLSREETDTRFDDITAFADIGDFLEQPVKTYSSGMMVRLAFAVIAHVDANILIVDEALSVGDAFFTQKCLRFLRRFMQTGTVLFVSHDMIALKNFCKSAMWLDNGTLVESGTPEAVSNSYLKHSLQEEYGAMVTLNDAVGVPKSNDQPTAAFDQNKNHESEGMSILFDVSTSDGWKTGKAEILSVQLEKLGNCSPNFVGGETTKIKINCIAVADMQSPMVGFIAKNKLGEEVFGENTVPFTIDKVIKIQGGQKFTAEFDFKMPILRNGQYVLMLSLGEGNTEEHIHHHYVYEACPFTVHSSQIRFGVMGVEVKRIGLHIESEAHCE